MRAINIFNNKDAFIKHILNNKIVAIALLMLSPIAQAEPLVTLKDMVQKVITANPEVQARYHAYEAAGYEQEQIKDGYYPKADIVSTYRNQEKIGDSSAFSASGTAIPRLNNELVLRQMIFDGFATRNEVNRLGHSKRVRYYELQSIMQNASLEFVRAYIDTLRYQELVDYAKNNYIVHKQLYDRIEERVNAGVARRVDLEQAKGRLALAEANLLTETTNLHDVTARMQRILGELPPQTLEAIQFEKTGVETTVTDALRVAYIKNPDLLSTIEDIQAVKDEVKTKKARFFPRLDLEARKNLGVSRDGRNSTSAADVLQLTMNFNLFNGFSDKNLLNQTEEKLNSAQDQRNKACVDTRQLVVIAYNDIKSLQEQLVYRDEHQKSIENAREAYRKQFDIGQRTLLDLLDTENEYFQAKRAYALAKYDIQAAYSRVYAGQGELLAKIGSSRAGLPDFAREEYMNAENICKVDAPTDIEINKAELVANAKPLSAMLPSLIKPIVKPDVKVDAKAEVSCSTEAITSTVNDWAAAWREKNYAEYIKFYADSFQPEPPISRTDWEKQRKIRLAIDGKIDLDLHDVKVTCDGAKAKAEFVQDYSLTTYKTKNSTDSGANCGMCKSERMPVNGFVDKVNKELDFEHQNNQWKIVKELSHQ